MKSIHLNARSVKFVSRRRNKIIDLQCLTTESKCHVCASTETWLTEDVSDSELFPDGFNVYWKDRQVTAPKTRGGGVLLAIADHILSRWYLRNQQSIPAQGIWATRLSILLKVVH